MKLTVSALALALVATAAIATNHSARNANPVASHQVMSAHLPVPMCPANDPKACGIDKL